MKEKLNNCCCNCHDSKSICERCFNSPDYYERHDFHNKPKEIIIKRLEKEIEPHPSFDRIGGKNEIIRKAIKIIKETKK